MTLRTCSTGMELFSAAKFRRRNQSLHNLAVFEMRLDDFVDVGIVDVGVPGAFGVDHRYRAGGAAVQATGLVHAHLARAREPCRLDLRFAAIKARLCIVVGTAVFAIGAVVQAKEDVVFLIGCGWFGW